MKDIERIVDEVLPNDIPNWISPVYSERERCRQLLTQAIENKVLCLPQEPSLLDSKEEEKHEG